MTENQKMPLPRLRALIARKGLTQAEAAEAAELSPGQLSQIISGNRGFSRSSLARIAAALDTTVAQILSEPEQPPQPEADALPCPDDRRLDEATIRRLAPAARTPASFISTRSVPAAGILSGDQIIIDLGTGASLGEMVLAQVVDPNSAQAVSLVRRWIEPYLAEIGTSNALPVMKIEHGQCGPFWCNILGPIVAVIRQIPSRDIAA